MNITDNTVFIPGATSGIGRVLAIALHDKGNVVVAGGRRRAELDRLAAEHPGIATIEIDTADAASITTASQRVIDEHPDVNVLVAMAGIMRPEDWSTPDAAVANAEDTVVTNVLGPMRLIGAFLDHLRSTPDATVVTVSSGLAFAPLKATPSYNATEAAIHMFSESLRLQLAGTSVSVMELVPPAVRTDLMPGHAENERAMPLDAYISEVMQLLESQPDAHEILVETVKFLRFGEARGDYDTVVQALNS